MGCLVTIGYVSEKMGFLFSLVAFEVSFNILIIQEVLVLQCRSVPKTVMLPEF